METKFQSSFIPRGPLAPTSSAALRNNSKKHSLIGFIAFLIFIFSVIACVAVYGYEKYQVSHIAKMGEDLEAARASLEADAITAVTRLNTRIESTQTILDSHTVVSPVFDFLESSTVKNVRFTDFKLENSGSDITLSLRGQAKSYSTLALQADQFNKSKYIRNPIFSDLSLDEKGNVTFSFKADLDQSLISYKSLPQKPGGAVLPVTASTTPGTSTPVSASSTTSQ